MCERMSLCLTSRHKPVSMVVSAACGCWACRDCGAKLREKWADRGRLAFAQSAMWQLSVCNRKQFQAIRHRLAKQKRGYFRIRIADTSYVFHQPLLATRQYTPDQSQWISSETAVQRFREILRRPGVSRVSSSGVYRQADEPKQSDWVRTAVVRRPISSINEFLLSLGIDPIIPLKSFPSTTLDVILNRSLPSGSPIPSVSSSSNKESGTTHPEPTVVQPGTVAPAFVGGREPVPRL